VGYLTKFDSFVLFLFFMLFGCCMLHQLVVRLQNEEKLGSWPLRKVYIRLVEFFGRLVIIPLVCSVYLGQFSRSITHQTYSIFASFITIFIFGVGIREFCALRKTFRVALAEIIVKIDSFGDVSQPEVFLVNLVLYRIVSGSMKHKRASMVRRQAQAELEIVSDGSSLGSPREPGIPADKCHAAEAQAGNTDAASANFRLSSAFTNSRSQEDSDDETSSQDISVNPMTTSLGVGSTATDRQFKL
jgi:hypothetical protein